MQHYDPIVVGFNDLNFFGIKFALPNWYMVDFDDKIKDRADVFFQVNVQKNKTKNVRYKVKHLHKKTRKYLNITKE